MKVLFQRALSAGIRLCLVAGSACLGAISLRGSGEISVSTDALLEYYARNRDALDIVEAQHIAILRIDRKSGKRLPEPMLQKQESIAREILNQALKGTSFDLLVEQWSQDLSSRESRGRFRFHRHTMLPAFDAWCFQADIGEIGFVMTKEAFHIIRLNWRSDFHDVRNAVKSSYLDQHLEDSVDGRQTQPRYRFVLTPESEPCLEPTVPE